MPHCDIIAGHYYGQLMTTAHGICRWPAAARFTEHGQNARHCPPLGNHDHCPANDNVGLKGVLNNALYDGKKICPYPYIKNQIL